MTATIDLPMLLASAKAEVERISAGLRAIEAAILPVLLDMPEHRAALQPLDPVLQHLDALAHMLGHVGNSCPPVALPSVSAALSEIRLARFMPDLQDAGTRSPAAADEALPKNG